MVVLDSLSKLAVTLLFQNKKGMGTVQASHKGSKS